MFSKKSLAMLGAEFVGTAVLVLTVISVRASGIGYSFFVALGAGLAVAILTFVLSANSGAHFNPALTLGLWTARKVKTLPTIVYVVVQLLGAWAAYGLYTYLANTNLPAPTSHYLARVLIAEGVGMFVFTFAWTAAMALKYEGVRLAATVGGAFALAIMIASLGSLGLVNPAIALGVRQWPVWSTAGWGTYVAGPLIGGIVGVNAYKMLFAGKAVQPNKKK